MTETRPYYSNNYSRNNDYSSSRERPSHPKFTGKKRSHSILPPPSILQAYEELSEGAAERLIDMAEQEQAHRHAWENACLRHYNKSHRIGQLIGLVLALSIIGASLFLALKGDIVTASSIALGGFSALIINTVVTAKTRRLDRKPRRFNNKLDASRRFAQDDEEDERETA